MNKFTFVAAPWGPEEAKSRCDQAMRKLVSMALASIDQTPKTSENIELAGRPEIVAQGDPKHHNSLAT